MQKQQIHINNDNNLVCYFKMVDKEECNEEEE